MDHNIVHVANAHLQTGGQCFSEQDTGNLPIPDTVKTSLI